MERKTISAHEINKFTYCPYQWYYERLYGRKKLRQLYEERNEALSLGDGMNANFTKGLEFHKKNYARLRMVNLAWKISVLVFILGGVIFYLWMRSGANV